MEVDDVEAIQEAKGYDDDEMELYVDGYTDALQAVADGCFELMDLVKSDNKPEGTCPICGHGLIQEIGTDGKFCPNCEDK